MEVHTTFTQSLVLIFIDTSHGEIFPHVVLELQNIFVDFIQNRS